MPDLVMSLARDGTIISHGGGRSLRRLAPPPAAQGMSLESVWPRDPAQIVRQLVRKAIAARGALETSFTDDGQAYRARVTPEGPDRAMCVVMPQLSAEAAESALSSTGSFPRPYLERRGFLRLFQESIARQILTEQPASLVAVHLGGVEDLARTDAKAAEQVVTSALMRLSVSPHADLGRCLCIGQLSESQLAFVLSVSDRQSIDAFGRGLLEGLHVPIELHGERFELTCHAGVSILGRDATSSKELLDCALLAAGEARRSAAVRPRFFSDTMKMAARSRQDVVGELREAIASQAIQTRCVGRHDLSTGELLAVVAYAQWLHPLRGRMPAAEFLSLADVTGEAVAMSRALLHAIGRDFDRLSAQLQAGVRFSYGPLRRHLLHADFLTDVSTFLAKAAIPAARFEVRIAESVFVSLPAALCDGLRSRAIHVLIDEVGRGAGSLHQLARTPLWGMQLDRVWVGSLCTDDVARRVCKAGIAAATALGVVPVACDVDSEPQRQALLALGCRVGSGDVFPASWSTTVARRTGDLQR